MELKLWFNSFWLYSMLMYITETSSQFLIASTQWSGLYSPNYPHRYPKNVDVVYELVAQDYKNKVCVKKVSFDLELTTGCTRDYLALQNSLTSKPFGYWCGGYMPYKCAENGVMYIRFRSDNNNVTGYGFHLMFREEDHEKSVPISMILGVSVIPLIILVILVCFCFGRRKKRFNSPMGLAGVDNTGSSTQIPESSCTVASISHPPGFNPNNLGPPSYESTVTNGINDLPPSYESIVKQENKTE